MILENENDEPNIVLKMSGKNKRLSCPFWQLINFSPRIYFIRIYAWTYFLSGNPRN